jgi:hypothetical protein
MEIVRFPPKFGEEPSFLNSEKYFILGNSIIINGTRSKIASII